MRVITVYCDGGCRGNGLKDNIGAWAYTLESGESKKEGSGLERNTTNNRMELTACINALSVIKARQNVEVNVHLDSEYTLKGITEWINGWKARGWRTAAKKPVENQDLWVKLDELKSQFSHLTFIKVKGHSDNEGNNRVDELCNIEMNNA